MQLLNPANNLCIFIQSNKIMLRNKTKQRVSIWESISYPVLGMVGDRWWCGSVSLGNFLDREREIHNKKTVNWQQTENG